MNETKKIEVKGKTYDLTDLDTLNIREKATMPDLSAYIPYPLVILQNMNGMEGYALGVKSVCDCIARYIEEYKGIRVFTSVMEIDNVIALLERIRQESGADNIKV